MDKSSHPVHASDAMSSSSYQAFEGQEPISPTTSIQPIVRPATPGASSDLSTSTSLSRSQRQKHDSFIMSGSVFLITSDGRTLSLPIPSESPYDPLNWSWKRRVVALTPGILFAWAGLILTTGASLTMNGLITDFITQETGPFTLETLITAPTLFIGIGAFLWVPLTFALGRRPPFILAAACLFLACLGAGFSRSFYQLLICVCAMGFAEGFSLSAGLLIIIDLTFIHQRPWAIAMIWSIVGFLGTISLSSVPYITDHGMQWRRFFLYWSIPAGIACVLCILFFPETYFKRPTVAYDGLTILQTASEKLTIYEDDGRDSNWSIYNKTLPATPSRNCFQNFFDQVCIRVSRASWKSMFLCYPQIFFCFVNPLIFWVVVMTAFNFAGMLFIGSTYAVVLRGPPYKLSSALLVQVTNFAGLGSLLAWPIGGSFVCFFLKRLSKRNKGVREAEHYLIGYILPVTTGALSSLIYGLAVHYKWHFATYYLAYGLNCFSFISLAIANTLWVTEAFPRWAAPALVVVGGGSYIVSFAMSFALVPWIEKQGFLLVGVELMAAQAFTGLICTPIAFWGKGVRQMIHGRWAERREGALRPL